MAVPARDETHLPALHQAMLIDDVLEHLVQGVAHVQGAVGIRGAVMQGEHWAGIVASQIQVDAFLFPEGLEFRFAVDGIGTHAKPRLQQVEGVFVGRSLISVLACLLGHVGAAAKGIISLRRCVLCFRLCSRLCLRLFRWRCQHLPLQCCPCSFQP